MLGRSQEALHFPLRGIDSDNGSEFINDHLFRYCQARAIQFTRGRPYKKDCIGCVAGKFAGSLHLGNMKLSVVEKVSKALADETRLRIFQATSAADQMTCGEIVSMRRVTPATVSSPSQNPQRGRTRHLP